MSLSHKFDIILLHRGREVCPCCQRAALGFSTHPQVVDGKDYRRIVCRSCRSSFKNQVKRKDNR